MIKFRHNGFYTPQSFNGVDRNREFWFGLEWARINEGFRQLNCALEVLEDGFRCTAEVLERFAKEVPHDAL